MTRLTIYGGGTETDVAVPDGIPVATLLPHLHDLLTGAGADPEALCAGVTDAAGRVVDTSKSLRDNGVGDGATLLLVSPTPAQPSPVPLEPAAACDRVALPPGFTAAAGVAMATAMVASAAVFATPGTGLPDVLVGTSTAAVAAVVSGRICGDHTWWWGALTCLATVWAVAALAATLVTAGTVTAAVLAVVLSLAVLTTAVRVAASVHRLGSLPDPGPRLREVRDLITSLVAGSAAAAATGVAVVTAVSPDWASSTLAAVTAAVLVLRIRAHHDAAAATGLCGAALLALVCCVVATHRHFPGLGWELGATAVVASLGVSLSRGVSNPFGLRTTRVLELVLLTAAVPVSGWVLGVFTPTAVWP
jgi:hypothetical protein